MTESYFKLVLIRHGETNENVQAIIQGCKDTKLNENGRNQAKCLSKSNYFDWNKFNKIYSSDLSRAYETCQILLNNNNGNGDDDNNDDNTNKIITDQLLRERSFGIMEGHNLSELIQMARKTGVPVPELVVEGGESIHDVSDRVKKFLEENLLPEIGSGDNILVVSHGGVIRQLIEYLSKFDSDKTFDRTLVCRIPPNTSVNEFKVIFENDSDNKKVIKKVQCINLHQINHLDLNCQRQALDQPQINANVEM